MKRQIQFIALSLAALLVVFSAIGYAVFGKRMNRELSRNSSGINPVGSSHDNSNPIPKSSASSRPKRMEGLPDLTNRNSWLNDKGGPVYIDRKLLWDYVDNLKPEDLDLTGPEGGFLRSLFYWAEASEIARVLRIFSKTQGNESTKNLFLTQLLSRSISRESDSNFVGVMAAIKESLGTGTTASNARMQAFGIAGFAPDVLAELRSINDPDQRRRLLIQMSHSVQWDENLERIRSVNSLDLRPDEKAAFAKALALRVSNSKGLGADFKGTLEETLVYLGKGDMSLPILDECARLAPFETWSILTDLPSNLPSADIHSVRLSSASAMAQQNGSLAMNRIVDLAENNERTTLVQVGLKAFMVSNPQGAKEWMDKNANKLQPEELDLSHGFLADFSLGNNDISAARTFVSKIKNDELRSAAEGRIWNMERNILRDETSKNPSGTIESIIGGRSQYAEYWIEDAMGTWLAKDFDKAQTWHQDNWQKLPASKAQYLAAAFANQAASEGDTDTARQWAIHIQDPKTKQRIEAGIAKAEAAVQDLEAAGK